MRKQYAYKLRREQESKCLKVDLVFLPPAALLPDLPPSSLSSMPDSDTMKSLVCCDVHIEPELQPVTGEVLTGAIYNAQQVLTLGCLFDIDFSTLGIPKEACMRAGSRRI